MTMPNITRADWIEHQLRWNAQIDEFERLWACWVSEKRGHVTHWRIEDAIWVKWHALSCFPDRIDEASIAAVRDLVDEFRAALEKDPTTRRRRRFTVGPATPNDFHLSGTFPVGRLNRRTAGSSARLRRWSEQHG